MLKVLYAVILLIHGFIHLLGFVKGFELAKITQLTHPISKTAGVFWLINTFLFIGVAVVFLLRKDWWWILGFLAVILSQILIFTQWQDAKFGTIANIIILIPLITGFAFWNFNAQINTETKELLAENKSEQKIITEEMIQDLPSPVQRWLRYSEVIGKEQIHTVYLKQKGLMKLRPDQKEWLKAEAEQYFTIEKPSFIWRVKTSMAGLPVLGRDLFRDGQGKMQIKLAGIVPVVNIENDPKLNISTLQRFLGEICWFPTAALSPYIKWEPIDDYSAKATMFYGETTGSAVFYFDEKGALTKFVAFRFKDISDPEPKEWVAKVIETETVNGIKVPTKLEASWILEDGEFTWYKFEICDLKYNSKFDYWT